MTTLDDFDEHISELHREIVAEYETRLLHLKEQQQSAETRVSRRRQEISAIIRSSTIDYSRLEALENSDVDELEQHLLDVRPRLIDREVRKSHKRSAILSATASEVGAVCLQPYATSILAEEREQVEDIDGEMGNPLLMRYDPTRLDMKRIDKGSGSGLIASGMAGAIYENVMFTFIPSSTGWWNFFAFIPFHGFYILRSDDGFWTSKYATVRVTVFMRVHQYHWHSWKTIPVLYEHDDNIDTYDFYDAMPDLTYSAPLTPVLHGAY